MPIDPARVRIVPSTEADLEAVRACIDAVALERRSLAFVAAPPLDETRAHVDAARLAGMVQFLALDGERTVGWCDVIPYLLGGFRHGGRLGMGLLPGFRGRGIARRLVLACIEEARRRGLDRVELEAYASSAPALARYEGLGFEHEGVKRCACTLDGAYEDIGLMALLLPGVQ